MSKLKNKLPKGYKWVKYRQRWRVGDLYKFVETLPWIKVKEDYPLLGTTLTKMWVGWVCRGIL